MDGDDDRADDDSDGFAATWGSVLLLVLEAALVWVILTVK